MKGGNFFSKAESKTGADDDDALKSSLGAIFFTSAELGRVIIFFFSSNLFRLNLSRRVPNDSTLKWVNITLFFKFLRHI